MYTTSYSYWKKASILDTLELVVASRDCTAKVDQGHTVENVAAVMYSMSLVCGRVKTYLWARQPYAKST